MTGVHFGMNDRAANEKAFCDEAYPVERLAHEKYLWSKFITERG
jgi:hypothetical protein